MDEPFLSLNRRERADILRTVTGISRRSETSPRIVVGDLYWS